MTDDFEMRLIGGKVIAVYTDLDGDQYIIRNGERCYLESMPRSYEIGGVCCQMTWAQATLWNRGELTAELARGATVYIPSRTGCLGRLIDGEVVVYDGHPDGEYVDFWTAISGPIFADMDGMPANLCS